MVHFHRMRPGEGGVHRRGGLKALVSMEDGMKYEYDVPDNIDGLAVDAKNSTRFSTTSRHPFHSRHAGRPARSPGIGFVEGGEIRGPPPQ